MTSCRSRGRSNLRAQRHYWRTGGQKELITGISRGKMRASGIVVSRYSATETVGMSQDDVSCHRHWCLCSWMILQPV